MNHSGRGAFSIKRILKPIPKSKSILFWITSCFLIVTSLIIWKRHLDQNQFHLTPSLISKKFQELSNQQGLDPSFYQNLPTTLDFKNASGDDFQYQMNYTIQTDFQAQMHNIISQYNPDYAAFVALDAETGKVLALLSHQSQKTNITDHLALRSTFPSASIFNFTP